MTRVAIIGNAGGGKSVLARFVAGTLGLPLHTIDDVQWQPGWRPAPYGVLAREHDAWLRSDRWVIDGWGTPALIARRLEAADTIVLVDMPLALHYWWAWKRHVAALLGVRRGWPPQGCTARGMFTRLAKLMWRIHRQNLPDLRSRLHEEHFRERLVHIRSPRELRAFRERLTTPAAASSRTCC